MKTSSRISFLALSVALLACGSLRAQSEIYPQHFDLEQVTLLDGPLKTAQDLNIQYLLAYDVDRLLTPFVRQAGLSATTDTTSPYFQWETKHPNHANWGSGSFRLDGHVGGHYLTALALAYAACHDTGVQQQLLARIDYILPILKDCQDAFDADKTGLYGYIGGQPLNDVWQDMYTGSLTKWKNVRGWVPFYCEHKVLAGLRDIALYTADDASYSRSTVAARLYRKLCDWSVNVVANLTETQMQSVLDTEHGGMNETLIDAFRLFGDSTYLTAAKRYSHKTMVTGMQTLSTTFLDGKHANTQVPKYIGFARIAQEDAGATAYSKSADNFWTNVANNRTVCIGGNSVNEHFIGAAYGNRYIDETNGPESCNSNNMLKLSETLFDTHHDGKYADFYEGTMYNHILSTQDPLTGGYVYFTPLRPQSYRIYSKIDQDMWCCVGTGMENHSKYGHFVYTHAGDSVLYVNLFTASQLQDPVFAVTQQTAFPAEQATRLTVDRAGSYTLAIRRPSWAGEGFAVSHNGKQIKAAEQGGYCYYKADFKAGDVVSVSLPMSLRYEVCPGLSDYIAFKYGPLLLSARTTSVADGDGSGLAYEALSHEYALGERMGHAPDSYAPKCALGTMPMLIGNRDEVLSRIRQDGDSLRFTIDVSRNDTTAASYGWTSLTLEPFYRLHHSRVMTYWYQQTYAGYAASSWAQAELEAHKLELRTVDKVDVGQQQAEAGVVTYSTDSNNGSYLGEDYRDSKANGWIEIVLNNKEPEAKDLALILRYTTADQGRKCSVYVNGTLLQTYTVPKTTLQADGNGFFNAELPLGSLAFDADGKTRSTYIVRIVASGTTLNPGLYYIRLVKDYKPSDYVYRYKASDWAYSGDAGRVSQSRISCDTTNNAVSLTQSGTNNICLKFGADSQYEVTAAQKYLVIRGTNLNASTGCSYLWWLNGANAGSQVAPTSVSTLADSRVQLVWDITKSGLTTYCSSDPWVLTTANNANSTLFGLTAKANAKPVVISYIGFLSEAQLAGTEAEPAGDYLSLDRVSVRSGQKDCYNLNGTRARTRKPGFFYIWKKRAVMYQ